MKSEEEIVYKYLLYKNFDEIRYEPNRSGPNFNIPPDFSIKGNIGIEVRRLNQHLPKVHKNEPLEALTYNFIPMLETLLRSYELCEYSVSAFLMIRYSRPLSPKKAIKQIKKELDTHLPQIHISKTFVIGNNLSITLLPASNKLDSAYKLGNISDSDAGGFVLHNVYSNLVHVVREKQNKIKPYLSQYHKWWLILVDYISYGLTTNDLNQLNNLQPLDHSFERIVLLSPLDFTDDSEVKL